MVRETVAMETLAARAMVRMSMRSDVLLSTFADFALLFAILS
jgi:hypothetical protein